MTHHERTTIADRCARCDGIPDAQRLLAEMRAQLEEARRERDEAQEQILADARERLLEHGSDEDAEQLRRELDATRAAVAEWMDECAERTIAAEQAVKVAEALAAVALTDVYRVSELKKRVALLENLLRRYRDHHDDLTHDATGDGAAGCFCSLCDEAHDVLEVEP